MTFDINQFRSEIQTNGYLRPWEYNVLLTPPPGLAGSSFVQQNQSSPSSNMPAMISLRATQARTPSAQLDWLDIPRYGIGLKVGAPYNAKIKNTHIAITCDKHGNIYNFFHSWLNYVFAFSPIQNAQAGGVANSPRGTYLINYKDDYSTTININMYNQVGALAMEFIMFQAFPVTIGEIPLDWDMAKALVELQIVFDFPHYSLSTSNLGQGQLNSSLTSPPSSSNPTLTPIINP